MLTGRHVKLRAWNEDDLGFFHDLRNDVMTQLCLMSEPRPHTAADTLGWLQARTAERDQVFFVIEQLPNDETIGFVELRSIRPPHGHATLGIYLSASARGKGRAAEALELITRYGIEVIGLRKIVLQVFDHHARAVRLYERAGFERVGVQRAHFYFGGKFHDVLMMEKVLSNQSPEANLPWTQ
jgi:RimJ/RimL family protein N-acetyltransferase